jgi:hypothetical protein
VTADGVLDLRHKEEEFGGVFGGVGEGGGGGGGGADGGGDAADDAKLAGIGRLGYLPRPGLRNLALNNNLRLTALPAGLGRLPCLVWLSINGCPGLALERAIQKQGGLPALLAYLRGEAVEGVAELNLAYLGLTVLSEGIVRLVGLKKLNLRHNHGLTALPEGLDRLRNLEALDINYCPHLAVECAIQKQGGLPALLAYLRGEAIEGVTELDLDHCGLMALPEGIARLSRLKKLWLGRNEGLTALPEGLCSLAGLEVLDLSGCGLSALPDGFGGLVGLRTLNLFGGERLGALPEDSLSELWSLTRLEDLNLANCGLRALPEGIGRLTALRKLNLCFNDELTALPAGLGQLRNLETLDIAVGCPGLAALHDWQEREGLPAVLASGSILQGGDLVQAAAKKAEAFAAKKEAATAKRQVAAAKAAEKKQKAAEAAAAKKKQRAEAKAAEAEAEAAAAAEAEAAAAAEAEAAAAAETEARTGPTSGDGSPPSPNKANPEKKETRSNSKSKKNEKSSNRRSKSSRKRSKSSDRGSKRRRSSSHESRCVHITVWPSRACVYSRVLRPGTAVEQRRGDLGPHQDRQGPGGGGAATVVAAAAGRGTQTPRTRVHNQLGKGGRKQSH